MLKLFTASRRVLSRLVLASLIFISMSGATAANAETIVTDEQSFADAINSTETDITVANDIILTNEYLITRDLTIKSMAGATLSWGGAAYNTMFTAENYANLTLESITLDGNGMYVILVKVYGATLTMNDGAVLQNVLGSSAGKAVIIGDANVPGIGGTFNMNGGLITGVSIDSPVLSYYGTINMGGSSSVSDNTANAIALIGSTLNMTGNASISDNTTSRTGAGVLAGENSVVNMGLNEGDAPRITGNNSTSYYGGGLYLDDSELNIGYNAFISGNTATTMGGGVALNESTMVMNGNAIISGNTATQGVGGGILANQSTVHLSGNSAVYLNSVLGDSGRGGGIYLQNAISLLTISDNANVFDNASALGAGVYLNNDTELNMNGGAISSNLANLDGGGIYSRGKLTLSGGVVDGNRTVNGNGAGIYLESNGIAAISGADITNNAAPNGFGGGIFTETAPDYVNLSTDTETRFYGNRAVVAYTPPEDASTRVPNIQFASVSIDDHPLNNYDINNTDTDVLMFDVTYESNGGTGRYVGPETVPSNTVMILSPEEAGIARANHIFIGWNTAPDGSGQSYQPGDTMVLNNNVTLYAQWRIDLEWFWWLILAFILILIAILICFCFCGPCSYQSPGRCI